MSAAVAEAIADEAIPDEAIAAEAVRHARAAARDNVVPHPAMQPTIGGIPVTPEVFEEAKAGAHRLMQMPPEELRSLIAKRVKMLQTELSEREARRAAIEEAMVAQRVLDARRKRARRLRRRVNIGSSLVAAMFTGLVVVNMF